MLEKTQIVQSLWKVVVAMPPTERYESMILLSMGKSALTSLADMLAIVVVGTSRSQAYCAEDRLALSSWELLSSQAALHSGAFQCHIANDKGLCVP